MLLHVTVLFFVSANHFKNVGVGEERMPEGRTKGTSVEELTRQKGHDEESKGDRARSNHFCMEDASSKL